MGKIIIDGKELSIGQFVKIKDFGEIKNVIIKEILIDYNDVLVSVEDLIDGYFIYVNLNDIIYDT